MSFYLTLYFPSVYIDRNSLWTADYSWYFLRPSIEILGEKVKDITLSPTEGIDLHTRNLTELGRQYLASAKVTSSATVETKDSKKQLTVWLFCIKIRKLIKWKAKWPSWPIFDGDECHGCCVVDVLLPAFSADKQNNKPKMWFMDFSQV